MKGNTLIETLIYIALLSMIMVGVFSSVYIIINSGERASFNNNMEDSILLLRNYHE